MSHFSQPPAPCTTFGTSGTNGLDTSRSLAATWGCTLSVPWAVCHPSLCGSCRSKEVGDEAASRLQPHPKPGDTTSPDCLPSPPRHAHDPFPFCLADGSDTNPPECSGSPEAGRMLPGQQGGTPVQSRGRASAQYVDCFSAAWASSQTFLKHQFPHLVNGYNAILIV